MAESLISASGHVTEIITSPGKDVPQKRNVGALCAPALCMASLADVSVYCLLWPNPCAVAVFACAFASEHWEHTVGTGNHCSTINVVAVPRYTTSTPPRPNKYVRLIQNIRWSYYYGPAA